MNGETYQDEQEYRMQLALARSLREHDLRYLREQAKEEAKEWAKQQVKRAAGKLAKKAGQAVTKVLVRMLMQLVRMVVVFLVATPPGWVVDIVILIIIVSIVVISNPGGVFDVVVGFAKSAVCMNVVSEHVNFYMNPVCYVPFGEVGGFLGGKGNPLY